MHYSKNKIRISSRHLDLGLGTLAGSFGSHRSKTPDRPAESSSPGAGPLKVHRAGPWLLWSLSQVLLDMLDHILRILVQDQIMLQDEEAVVVLVQGGS